MSSVKIALQPPPNVDFVVGYPGIPPGARDRPQAAVKGAVEVRVGPQGAKAKWVRVELKKIETLPGGGQTNSYFDFVGSSPVNLWQSSEEYGMLHSQDLPFYIRIPESIPPSIALEKGAGIRYELVATVCTLGKKGFFRRRKTNVISQATTIIIDKHELHSTWPVYSQPESRHVTQDGLNLTVERARTCFGPGDRVSATAILKSNSTQPVTLRDFEFTLKETTIFRAGPQAAAGKRNGPQVKVTIIGEQKVPLNVVLYGGSQHKAEVGCLIPNTHTTTSLNAARHIDITYVVLVKASLGSMQSIVMELPVIVSNWPRSVSEEAIRRIGAAPSLCVVSPTNTAPTIPVTAARPLTGNSHAPSNSTSTADFQYGAADPNRQIMTVASSMQFNTAPSTFTADREVDELGELGLARQNKPLAGIVDHPGCISSASPQRAPSVEATGATTLRPTHSANGSVSASGRKRRPSATGSQNRFTVTNISENDAELREAQQQANARAVTPPSAGRRPQWPTAEDEKKRLYDKAKATAAQTQNIARSLDEQQTPSPKPVNKGPGWLSAEQEKIRLYENAQSTAKRTQAFGGSPPPSHSRNSSDANGSITQSRPSPSGPSIPTVSAGAALYQHAVSSMSKNATGSRPYTPPSSRSGPHYPSAEEEKAALRRYEEAKRAVDRSQNTQYASSEGISSSAPISYDTLYPQSNGSPSNSGGGHSSGGEMPPPFQNSGTQQPSYITEKEKLRRAYEAQDAAAEQNPPNQTPLYSSPSYTAPPQPQNALSALSEKELLRRKYEEQDAAAAAPVVQSSPPQPPPPRATSGSRSGRTPPAPPGGEGFKPLTAAEEKAQLRAKYEAEDQRPNGYASASYQQPMYNGSAPNPSPPPPPPLLPRPPAEYIQETQMEDARARYYENGMSVYDPTPQLSPPADLGGGIQLDIRPFTPFAVGLGGYDANGATPNGRPPLPPKFPPDNM
ncbi:hypothetical protein BJ138DRAFT_1115170 [Hygrophoropsis aurantiaca]|uniref:Uncharacterized protein n=1 Tax=Hygrophoropsis aurantiaca TaxID=72124 RepID=A0ACB8A830_9AGAM|nr:hypothetical protein BJ138DRAFT_1115170 [Hygrophoropsis aurantiaca]